MKGTLGLITTIMQKSHIKLLITLKTSSTSLKGHLVAVTLDLLMCSPHHYILQSIYFARFKAVIKKIRSINHRKKMHSSSFAFQSLSSVLEGKAEIPTNAILVYSVPNLTEKLLPNRRNLKHELKELRGIAF